MKGYEPRPSQAEMAAEVFATLRQGGVSIIEAGTGTGKTLAYLVPVLTAGKRVVISTGTKNLQEQLYFTDIPFLKKLGGDFRAAVMKGRNNYLCLRKIKQYRAQPHLRGMEEVDSFQHVDSWHTSTKTGDFQEISALPEGTGLLRRLSCAADNCIGRKCPDYADCWLVKAREKAAKADILVVNHHLLFADMAVKEGGFGSVLPEYDYVIFDEAHEIENVATSYFGREVSNWQFEELLRDTISELATEKLDKPELEKAAVKIGDNAQRFFAGLQIDGDRQRLRASSFSSQEDKFQALYESLESFESAISNEKQLPESIFLLARRAVDMRLTLQQIVDAADPGFVFWCERRGKGVFLRASPIDVSSIVRTAVFEQNEATVMVSATLTVQGEFDYIRKRLGATEATQKKLGSPYDYKSQTRLYIPKRFPLPNSRDFPHHVTEEVLRLLEITNGRAFILFTSMKNLNQVYGLLRERSPYPLFVQGTTSKRALLEGYLAEENPVLLASYSFWQGVDVKGEKLSQVIIDKLPFAVPDDPLMSARIDRIKQEGGNAFYQLQVPHAALMLKQGLGRLIRSASDKGIMAVLDNRLINKQYGNIILNSLYDSPLLQDLQSLDMWWQEKLGAN
jgi:ATP-dependent DNA helicase DinG